MPAKFAGQKIVLRLDSPTGAIIGTLTTAATADWYTYVAQTTKITGAKGIHNLYLTMSGSGVIANIKTILFS